MLILILIGLIIVLTVVVMVLHYHNTKAHESLFAARRDAIKLRARLDAARKGAQDAEARCTGLMHQVTTSLASTGQALSIARHIEVVRQQMAELLELVAYSDGQHADTGQPALSEHPPLPLEPDMTAYGPRASRPGFPEPVSLPDHHHVDHRVLTGPAAHPGSLTQPMRAIHPGQRRSA